MGNPVNEKNGNGRQAFFRRVLLFFAICGLFITPLFYQNCAPPLSVATPSPSPSPSTSSSTDGVPFIPPSSTGLNSNTVIRGAVTQMTYAGNFAMFLSGWACSPGLNTPVTIKGIFKSGDTGAVANIPLSQLPVLSASDVANAQAACGSGAAVGWQKTYFLASTAGGPAPLVAGTQMSFLAIAGNGTTAPIAGNGTFQFPYRDTATIFNDSATVDGMRGVNPIIGQVTGASLQSDGNVHVTGWACAVGYTGAAHLTVSIYNGGTQAQLINTDITALPATPAASSIVTFPGSSTTTVAGGNTELQSYMLHCGIADPALNIMYKFDVSLAKGVIPTGNFMAVAVQAGVPSADGSYFKNFIPGSGKVVAP